MTTIINDLMTFLQVDDIYYLIAFLLLIVTIFIIKR